ncbi:universal stress protein [Hyalangium gracile]|uniref:universal stress protein n=1 Tax=Hyalangium gracile TaxID=394092 RepID=UPI001CCBFDEC|nr:universal stress protein [Hyalangium gracile]
MLRSLLIPIDLSYGSKWVVERAALLPLAPDARLTLLHVVPRLLPKESRLRAEEDARQTLESLAKGLARALPQGVTVQQSVKSGSATAEIIRQARAVKAELLVMGRGRGRALRDIFLGSTAERVIRQRKLPVLVVRPPPHASYRRPLLALELDPAAHDVLAWMFQVLPTPRPRVSLVHAYDAPFQELLYPSLSTGKAKEQRERYRQTAQQGLTRLLSTSLERLKEEAPRDTGLRWKTYLRSGSPRTVIERVARKTRADLVVLGTHGDSGAAHMFLGTVAGDVLRAVPCDVLVVPPRQTSESSLGDGSSSRG